MMRYHYVILTLVVFCLGVAPDLDAYETYHHPSQDGSGYCASCHPGFRDGRSDTLHALHTGGSTPVTNNCSLCHTGSGRDNPLIMWSVEDGGNGLGCMGCHGRDYGETIWSNYGGFSTQGKAKSSGYGLRKHHLRRGVALCSSCHPDVSQAEIFPENVHPPYYSRSDVSFSGVPLDACSNEDSENDADSKGLDNDGDLLYDSGDTDCATPVPDIRISSDLLEFGGVTVGESADRSLEIQNIGEAELVVTGAVLCANTSPEYTWSPSSGFTVAPGGSQVMTVTFGPLDEGAETGCILIGSNDPDAASVQVDLIGTGTPALAPDLVLEPALLDFGNVPVGDASTLGVTLRNVGNAVLTVVAMGPCQGTGPEYSWLPTPPFTVAAGGTRTINVNYMPVELGSDLGCIVIESDDPGEPLLELPLSGVGVLAPEPEIVIDPSLVEFGDVFVGQSATLTADIHNAGTADLVVSALGACVGTSTQYSWQPQAPMSIPPGDRQSLTVTYAPLDVGVDDGCIEITSNDTANPIIRLGVLGSGQELVVEPSLVLTATSLSFGTVEIGQQAELTVDVQNHGNADLVLSDMSFCDGTSTEYSVSPVAPLTIQAGSAATLALTYSPVDAGLDEGCLSLWSNDPDTPRTDLSLTGTGIDPPTLLVDLDIVAFRVTKRLKLGTNARKRGPPSVTIKLSVTNPGATEEPRPFTVEGVWGGDTVYRHTVLVSAPVGGKPARVLFPAYVPDSVGEILWLVTGADDDPDIDEATALTRVMP